MRLLTDQDVYRITVEQLKKWGHDVVTAKELGMQRASDRDLLMKTIETNIYSVLLSPIVIEFGIYSMVKHNKTCMTP
jgi:hypothetical protein